MAELRNGKETHLAGPTVLSLGLGRHGWSFTVGLGASGRCPGMELILIQ
jgi:hypothetical protein